MPKFDEYVIIEKHDAFQSQQSRLKLYEVSPGSPMKILVDATRPCAAQ
jgi:hypothetical protein